MTLPVLLILLGILLFIQFLWLVMDQRPFQQIIRESSQRRLRATYRYVFLVLIMQLVCAAFFPLDIGAMNPIVSIIGITFYEVGISIAIWAKVVMKESFGRPGQHDINRQQKLITSGPFAYTRNPIYIGLLLMNLGFAVALKSYLIFLIFPLFFYIRDIIFTEEELLEHFFGDAYRRYKDKVHRFL